MFDSTTLISYLVASVAIILAPGPAQALVLTRTISDGKRAGIITAVGLNVGTIVYTVAAALGLSAVLATSAVAFSVVKYVGAAYLVYLGLKAFLAKEHSNDLTTPADGSIWQTFSKAVVIGVLNPNVALFFLAFLPQFIDPQRGAAVLQFLVLGSILAALDIVYESILALIAGMMSRRFASSAKFALWRQKVTGIVLIGLGMRLALVQRE